MNANKILDTQHSIVNKNTQHNIFLMNDDTIDILEVHFELVLI